MNINFMKGNKVESQQTSTRACTLTKFNSMSLEEKVHFLSGNQYAPQSSTSILTLLRLKDHLRKQLTETAISKIEGRS